MTIKEDALPSVAVLETDFIRGLGGGGLNSDLFSVAALRTRLNTPAQSFAGIVTFGSDIALGANDITGVGTIAASTLGGTLSTAAQANITSLGILSALTMAGDINQGGYELLQSKTIQDIQPFQYARGNGTSSSALIPDNIELNFGTNDFSMVIEFNIPATQITVDQLISKRSGSGSGYQLRIDGSQLLSMILDSGTGITIISDSAINDGLNKGAVIRNERAVESAMWLEGVKQASVAAGDALTTTNAENLYLFSDGGATEFINASIMRIVFFNRALTAGEAKAFSSNPNKAIDWVDEGGSNVAQNVSNHINGVISPYDTFDGASATGFHAISDGSILQRGTSADELVMVAGKYYGVDLSASIASGTGPAVQLRTAEGGSAMAAEVPVVVAGDNHLVFLCTVSGTGVVRYTNSNGIAGEYTLSAINFHQLGATLELKPQDMSPIKAKDSANQNDALFTDVELGNTALDHVYQDPYRAIADNDTFDVPEGCAFLELLLNVKTEQAGTGIRIGTSDGGEQVVVDTTITDTLGMHRLTMVLDGFSAGDTLHIGHDSGLAAWVALDADIYVRYQIIKV